MAKNLKIKVKNAQLAEALKINKLKKAPEETPEEKKSESSSKAQNAEASKKEASPESTQETSTVESKVVKQESVASESSKTTSEKKPAAQLKTASSKETKKSDLPNKPKVRSEKTTPKSNTAASKTTDHTKKPQKPTSDKATTTTTATPAKDPKSRGYFSPKERRKNESNRPFDSRDRHGLRGDEDGKGWRKKRYGHKSKGHQPEKEIVRPSSIKVRLPITVKDLAQEMKIKASQVISKLFLEGLVITINDYLEDETIVEIIGHEFKCDIQIDTSEEKRLRITENSISEEIANAKPEALKDRAPVIAFMGHVDHGKTSLIDAIRKSKIAAGEAGAITQHIGAFRCKSSHGDITILDTPGHEAFSLMRERGAAITDIVILVVAGDEGIKPQTIEAINHAKEAEVPIIVAINKADKEGFNPDNVYRELADQSLLPEAWGGEIITVNTSASTGEGITQLLEMITLQAEVLELKAVPTSRARGTVLESELHKGLGAVATILVQNGTLNVGDALVLDQIYGRVKTMHDDHGKSLETAGPSVPVKVTGLSGVPEAGCDFIVVDSEKEARKLCQDRETGHKRALLKQKGEGFDALLQRQSELQERKILHVIIRADVQGSVEAIKSSLMKIKSQKVELNVVSADVGEISESDIELASASGAVILGFHTRIESHAESLINTHKVKICNHNIIYHMIDEVKELMRQQLDKIRTETKCGEAYVKATFKASSLGVIAGCEVSNGVIKKNNLVKLLREGEIVFDGNIASLKRVNEDVREVKSGLECGILFENFHGAQVGDIVEAFEVTYIEQDL